MRGGRVGALWAIGVDCQGLDAIVAKLTPAQKAARVAAAKAAIVALGRARYLTGDQVTTLTTLVGAL